MTAQKTKKKKVYKKGYNYANNEKYPSLNPNRQVGNRKELVEVDYLDQLNDKEKEWLNAFNSETVVTNFDNHAGPKLYTEVEDRRSLYRDNNRRNKCIYTIAKVSNKLDTVVNYKLDMQSMKDRHISYEEALVEYIDDKHKNKKKLKK